MEEKLETLILGILWGLIIASIIAIVGEEIIGGVFTLRDAIGVILTLIFVLIMAIFTYRTLQNNC